MSIQKIKDWLQKAKYENIQFYFQFHSSQEVARRIKDNMIYIVGKNTTYDIEIDHFDTDCIHVHISVSGSPIVKVEINSLPEKWSSSFKVMKLVPVKIMKTLHGL